LASGEYNRGSGALGWKDPKEIVRKEG